MSSAILRSLNTEQISTLLLLILGTDPLVRLEVGRPLPVDLGHVGEGALQVAADGLEPKLLRRGNSGKNFPAGTDWTP